MLQCTHDHTLNTKHYYVQEGPWNPQGVSRKAFNDHNVHVGRPCALCVQCNAHTCRGLVLWPTFPLYCHVHGTRKWKAIFIPDSYILNAKCHPL
jgi:hypothetical protein